MSDSTRDILVESATSAFRVRDPSGRICPAPEWYDLAPADREALFQHQLESRLLERSVDPDGLSSTARAVLSRLRLPRWTGG
jgi:hypothetical protein